MKHVLDALKFLLDAHAASAISPSSAQAAANHSQNVSGVAAAMAEADTALSVEEDATAVLNAGLKLAADIKSQEAQHKS